MGSDRSAHELSWADRRHPHVIGRSPQRLGWFRDCVRPGMHPAYVRVSLRTLAIAALASAFGSIEILAQAQPAGRPVIGLAFGGGSAKGLAHIGVIQWFEEHRIPIDLVAGTSMGGLVGGAFSTGMPAAELRAMIEGTDWDAMFGTSSFEFKNVRRKRDARNYPSRLEFGLKGGVVAPSALNDGQQVDLFLARIAAPYYAVQSFDELPTPFRCVAVDLVSAERIVMSSGSLAQAMRATMSLPGIFPPIETEKRVLVDGGAMDNVPADVVRDMGATVVVAVDVGTDPEAIDYSLFSLMGHTVDAMMRASTRRGMAVADHTIKVDVSGFGSLDWRRSPELIQRGYEAASRLEAQLLPLALDPEAYRAWEDARQARRRPPLPTVQFLATSGMATTDAGVARKALAHYIGGPPDVPALERDLSALSGLDRYQGITWQMVGPPGREGLLIRARQKAYAPPFMMFSVNLENTTSNDFRFQLAARYLGFDAFGTGSELRIDGAIGSDPSLAASLHKPLGTSGLFVRGTTGFRQATFDFVADETVVAQYRERRGLVGGEFGANLTRISEVSGGLTVGRLSADVRAGDPGLPGLSGIESIAFVQYERDGQDSPVIPSRGWRLVAQARRFLTTPNAPNVTRTNDGLTQADANVSSFWTVRRRNRLFVVASAGTSFDNTPLPTEQFTLGRLFRLDAYSVGERLGDHLVLGTVGYLRQVGRLPDFLGGPVFAGLWIENGSAFNDTGDVDVHTQTGLGVILDTLLGPVVVGTGIGLDGGWRTFMGVGRIF
jgi:NTE family protein